MLKLASPACGRSAVYNRRVMTRRELLAAAMAAPLVRAAAAKIPIGITDWNLRLSANPEAIPLAAQLGFDGVQMSVGRRMVDNKMPLDNAEDDCPMPGSSPSEQRIPIIGTCADRLHDNGLKSDPLAVRGCRIPSASPSAVGTRVLLLPFFGKWAIEDPGEMRMPWATRSAKLRRKPKRPGVMLGLENTISAEDNVRIMDRAKLEECSVVLRRG